MSTRCRPLRRVLAVLLVAISAAPAFAGVSIDSQENGYRVTTDHYTAVIDAAGNFRSLLIDGSEFWNHTGDAAGGAFPGEHPATLRRDGDTVEAKNNDIRVFYTFKPDRILVEHKGAALVYALSDNVVAAISARGGKVVPRGQSGGFFRKLLTDSAAIAFGPHPGQGKVPNYRYLMHSARPRGSIAPQLNYMGRDNAGLRRYSILCDVPFEPSELLQYKLSAEGVSRFRVPKYRAGEVPVFNLALENLAGAPVSAEVVYTLKDHYYKGQPVFEQTIPLELDPKGKTKQRVETPVEKPGIYWIHAAIQVDGRTVKHDDMGIVYDAADYRPPLNRPDDFEAFWEEQIEEMRAIPFNATLTENEQRSTEDAIWYDLEMTVAAGKRLSGMFSRPRAEGTYTGRLFDIRGEVSEKKVKRWAENAGHTVYVGMPWPQTATFRTWTSRTENNMFDCYMLTVRLCDYLRSREEVDEIVLSGASRSGPLVLAAAALDARQIRYVLAHVPTSMGISWEEKPYRGWGGPGGVPQKRFMKIAPYMDPVNFAPMMRVPFIVDCGIYDDLAPAPGIVAFANHAVNSPWRRYSVEKGGHGYFPGNFRQEARKELQQFLEK